MWEWNCVAMTISKGVVRLKQFDEVTKPQVTALSFYRFHIIHVHDSHIILEFVQYCEKVNIKPTCLPHSTHLLQHVDISLCSPFQKVYGKAVD